MGRHPKAGAIYVNVTVKISRILYMKLQMIAVSKGMISHILLIEKLLEDYVKKHEKKENSDLMKLE